MLMSRVPKNSTRPAIVRMVVSEVVWDGRHGHSIITRTSNDASRGHLEREAVAHPLQKHGMSKMTCVSVSWECGSPQNDLTDRGARITQRSIPPPYVHAPVSAGLRSTEPSSTEHLMHTWWPSNSADLMVPPTPFLSADTDLTLR